MLLDPTALAGRTVLLTGATGGIGTVTAATLAAAGAMVIAQHRGDPVMARVALAGVPDDRLALVAGELDGAAAVRRLWARVVAEHAVDVLVLNAAVNLETSIDGPDEDWDAGWEQTLAVNVVGTGALLREAVRHFADHGGGTVVVISSWAAEQGSRLPDLSAYAASKAAVRNLAQTFARAYARRGVRVHVVAPGVVRAGMAVAGMDDSAQAAVADGLAMGRYVEAGEVAALVAFLTTDGCPSLTGSTVDINGASYIR